MEMREEKIGRVAVVAAAGRIDNRTAGDLERSLFRHLDTGEAQLLVDLSEVEYISSAGLRVLMKAANVLRKRGGRLVLCGLVGSVREVFDLAGLIPLLAVEPSRDRALARFSTRR